MSYYPGDAAVDWWGINYFTTGQMNNSEAFVLAAATHDKPVIICESSPIHGGGTDNPDNWQDWFVPYFGKISGHAHLKGSGRLLGGVGDEPDRRRYTRQHPRRLRGRNGRPPLHPPTRAAGAGGGADAASDPLRAAADGRGLGSWMESGHGLSAGTACRSSPQLRVSRWMISIASSSESVIETRSRSSGLIVSLSTRAC